MYLYLPITVRQHTEEIEQKLGDTCTETSFLLEICLSSAFCLSYWSILAASTVFPIEPYFPELPLHYQVCQDPCKRAASLSTPWTSSIAQVFVRWQESKFKVWGCHMALSKELKMHGQAGNAAQLVVA